MESITIQAPLPVVLSHINSSIDMQVGFVDPAQGISRYTENLGWQIIGNASSSGLSVVRRYRQGYKSHWRSNWSPDSHGGFYGPRLHGSFTSPHENETTIEYDFARNPSFWTLFVLVTILAFFAGFIGAVMGLANGDLSISSLFWAAPFLWGLLGSLPMAFITEITEKSALRDWLKDIKRTAEAESARTLSN